MFQINDSDENVRAYKQLRYKWQLRLSWWPRRCQLSGEWIPMFSRAYKGVRNTFIPNSSLKFCAWVSPERYIFEKLKGTLT